MSDNLPSPDDMAAVDNAKLGERLLDLMDGSERTGKTIFMTTLTKDEIWVIYNALVP